MGQPALLAVLASFHERAGAGSLLRRLLGGGPAHGRPLLSVSPGSRATTVDGLLLHIISFLDERRPYTAVAPLSAKRFSKLKKAIKPHVVRAKTGWSAFLCTVCRCMRACVRSLLIQCGMLG